MKIICVILILFFLPTGLLAQGSSNSPSRPLNNVSLNLGEGSGISVRYERIFPFNSYMFLAAGAGLGYVSDIRVIDLCVNGDCSVNRKYLTIPGYLTFSFGRKDNFAEVGLGHVQLRSSDLNRSATFPILGYRIQPIKSKNLNFRFYLCYPLKGLSKDLANFFPIGLSFGYCF